MKIPTHDTNGAPLVVLFDAMALAYRAYFAFISRPLTNAQGENTSAVYGFMTALFQFLDIQKPTYAAVCFDTPHPTFRHLRYEAYKATREAMPEDMPKQIDTIKAFVKAFNICLVEAPGYEADDIIGTIARQAEEHGIDVLIVTPDKDYCQLVTDHVKLLRPSRDGASMEIMDSDGVQAKYGLQPSQIIDYLALVGDSSDNIPGVRGIGEKTATPLLQEFGSLAALYDQLDKIPKKGTREKLTNERDNAFLSYELATIETHVPLTHSIDELRYGADPDFATLETLVTDLGSKTIANRVHARKEAALKTATGPTPSIADEATTASVSAEERELEAFDFSLETVSVAEADGLRDITNTPHAYVIIETLDGVRELAKLLSRYKEICFDVETTSSDANLATLIGISFAVQPHEAFYIPIRLNEEITSHGDLFASETEAPQQSTTSALNGGLDQAEVLTILRPILEAPEIAKIGQNIKYDALVLRHAGVNVHPMSYDTMIAAYLYRFEGGHSMDALAMEHLHYRPVALHEVVGAIRESNAPQLMAHAATDKLAEYGAEDADVTIQLKHTLAKKITDERQIKLLEDIEFPLIAVLTDMEFAGVKIDTEMLGLASKEMEREADSLCTEIYGYAGGPFNIDSNKQLQEVLFTKLGLHAGKKTKTGYSTNASVLDELRDEHPIAEALLKYRQYQKLRSTYVDALPRLVNPRTGFVHTNYNQAVVATGRISSTDPNLQNIPIKTELGREIRRAFVSRFPNGKILSSDYSQIELRVVAHVTGDASLALAFANNEDIHTSTAAGVFGAAPEQVTREMRRKAKEINYGIMYGMGAFGLARRLRIPQKEGAEIIQKYFAAFPSIRQYMDDTLAFGRKHGYVETIFGRRRYMRSIGATNQAVRAADERAAINAPIQGSAADLMKLAMLKVQAAIKAAKLESLMIMQVHDELVFDVAPGEEAALEALVNENMTHAMEMRVPLVVDVGIGKNWLEAH